MSGLFTIPDANLIGDGKVSIGMNWQSHEYIKSYQGYDRLVGYVNLGFLPFIEAGLRISYPYDLSNHAIGDRMPFIRIRLIEQKGFLPNIVVGAHDFLAVFGGTEAINFNSFYLVATRKGLVNTSSFSVDVTLGYGVDWIKAEYYQFLGVFGGIRSTIFKNYSVMIEYDSERINVGSEFTFFGNLKIVFGFMDMKRLQGGFSYSIQL